MNATDPEESPAPAGDGASPTDPPAPAPEAGAEAGPSSGPPAPSRPGASPIPEEITYIEPAPAASASPRPAGDPPRGFGIPSRTAPPRPQPTREANADARPAYDIEIDFPMPNAMIGRPYDAVVPLAVRRASGLPREIRFEDLSAVSRQIEGLEPLGLKAEPVGDKTRIHGDPKEPGDHPITVAYSVFVRGRLWYTPRPKRFLMTINPDPRSLWKEIEPDPTSPYRRPHTASERIVADAVVIAASRRGRSHANKGDHRDDAFRIEHRADSGWYILAVADGAGSAPVSRRGAEVACEAARDAILPHLTTTLGDEFASMLAASPRPESDEPAAPVKTALYKSLGAAGHRAYRSVVAEAEAAGRPAEDFATTLLFTIAKRYDFGWFAATIAVGDGGVGIYRRDAGVRALNRADSGDFAGQTRFLTMGRIWSDGEEIQRRIRSAVVPDFTAIVAMTDGVSDPKFGADAAFHDAGRWHALWADLSGQVGLTRENESADAQLLEWLNFWAVGNHDDRTIAILLP